MEQPREAFAIGAPAQIRSGVEGALGGTLEARGLAHGDESSEHAPNRLGGIREARFARTPPHLLVRVREERVDDIAEAGPRVETILVRELLRPDFELSHGVPRGELYAGP
jgi:hypothetical protein